jgi:hypothetical protein
MVCCEMERKGVFFYTGVSDEQIATINVIVGEE